MTNYAIDITELWPPLKSFNAVRGARVLTPEAARDILNSQQSSAGDGRTGGKNRAGGAELGTASLGFNLQCVMFIVLLLRSVTYC